MLTYRLTGTTGNRVDHDEPHQTRPRQRTRQQQRGAESSRTMVRLEDGAALLTCMFFGGA
jgi:hypothetical protein